MLAYLTTANQKVVRTGLFLYFWFSDVFRGKERDQGFLDITDETVMGFLWGMPDQTKPNN